VIELKTTKLTPADVGQLNFYVAAPSPAPQDRALGTPGGLSVLRCRVRFASPAVAPLTPRVGRVAGGARGHAQQLDSQLGTEHRDQLAEQQLHVSFEVVQLAAVLVDLRGGRQVAGQDHLLSVVHGTQPVTCPHGCQLQMVIILHIWR
jgi:hypothetical protein